MARTSPTAAFQSKGRQPLENIDQRVQTFEILSKRQKFMRSAKRIGWTAGALAAATLLLFVSPVVFRSVQEQLAVRGDASASAPAPQQIAAPAPNQSLSAVVAPRIQAGETIRDCASCPEMVVLPGGLFQMGSPATERGRAADEGPVREVSVAPVAVSKYEITFAQWDACLAGGGCNGFSPPDRGFGRGQHPVIGVSWDDAQAYLDWLNAQAGGLRYRLLTEAEWEYAARAGSSAPYAFGAALTNEQATFGARRSSEAGAHPANAFQLFDLHGNAAEWVEDCYVGNYNLAPIDGEAVQAQSCARRVVRGGAFDDRASFVRAAARRSAAEGSRGANVGFRVARTLD